MEEIWERGFAEGYEIGYAEGYVEGYTEGVIEGRSSIIMILLANGITIDEAFNLLDIPLDEREMYIQRVTS